MLKCATSIKLPCLALSNPPFLQLQSRFAMDSTETGSPPPPRSLEPQVLVFKDTPCRTLQEMNSSESEEVDQIAVSTNAQHNLASH